MHSYYVHWMETSMQHQAAMSLSLENEPPVPIWEQACWTWRLNLVVVQEQNSSNRKSTPDIQVAACHSDSNILTLGIVQLSSFV
jgi:hypothetical protein